MLNAHFFPNFGKGPFPKIVGKSPVSIIIMVWPWHALNSGLTLIFVHMMIIRNGTIRGIDGCTEILNVGTASIVPDRITPLFLLVQAWLIGKKIFTILRSKFYLNLWHISFIQQNLKMLNAKSSAKQKYVAAHGKIMDYDFMSLWSTFIGCDHRFR